MLKNLLSFLDLCKSLCLFLHAFVTAHYLLLYSTGWFRFCGVCWRDQEQREFPAHVEEADHEQEQEDRGKHCNSSSSSSSLGGDRSDQIWIPRSVAAVRSRAAPRANMSDALVNGLAGAGGGIVAQLLTYPLQAVNTRQHTERKARAVVITDLVAKGDEDDASLLSLPSNKNWPRTGGTTLEEIWKVIKQEGWEGLYRGLGPSLVGTACSQGVYYFFYQTFKNEAEARALTNKKLGQGDGSVDMFTSLFTAALAGCANVLLTNPIWVVVTRMQLSKRTAGGLSSMKSSTTKGSSSSSTADAVPIACQHGVLETVKDLYNEAGVLGLWKGVLPTLIMVSNPSIQFMIYESLLKRLTAKRPVSEQGLKRISAAEVFLLGAVAKLGATVVTYPLLVIKSRLQAKQAIGGDKSLHYSGTLDVVMKMLHYEGLAGFYKGMSTKIVQSVVAAAVLFMIKEELVKAARAVLAKGVKHPKVVTLKAVSS